ncbi:MAG: hypothetical protein GXP56_14245 [Deltaproteobacteria bacterium]|nr:hypothetical protein [Deltaproteobacteria bacterium]
MLPINMEKPEKPVQIPNILSQIIPARYNETLFNENIIINAIKIETTLKLMIDDNKNLLKTKYSILPGDTLNHQKLFPSLKIKVESNKTETTG